MKCPGSPCNSHSVLKGKNGFPSFTELGEILHWRFTHNAGSLVSLMQTDAMKAVRYSTT